MVAGCSSARPSDAEDVWWLRAALKASGGLPGDAGVFGAVGHDRAPPGRRRHPGGGPSAGRDGERGCHRCGQEPQLFSGDQHPRRCARHEPPRPHIESCTPTTGDRSQRSQRLSQRSSLCTSIDWLNNPLGRTRTGGSAPRSRSKLAIDTQRILARYRIARWCSSAVRDRVWSSAECPSSAVRRSGRPGWVRAVCARRFVRAGCGCRGSCRDGCRGRAGLMSGATYPRHKIKYGSGPGQWSPL
jgi:hypothetical protein